MSYRYLAVATLAAAGAIAALTSGCGATQNSAADGASGTSTWAQPRTAWGDPNLQGVWRYESTIAFERPKELEGRELLTDEEVAQKEQVEREQEAKRLAGFEGADVGRRSVDE